MLTVLTEPLAVEPDVLRASEDGVDCLVRVIESRDVETGQHVERMGVYCEAIAEAVGLDPVTSEAIGVAARLHDVGKIGIPDTVLRKDAPLTPAERAVVEEHCVVGHDILAGARNEILQLAAEIALTHHEWFDGTGYPLGLQGEEIPFAGRIAAIGDVFDALTSDRPYRDAVSTDDARENMLAERGSHFDPELLDVFLELELRAA